MDLAIIGPRIDHGVYISANYVDRWLSFFIFILFITSSLACCSLGCQEVNIFTEICEPNSIHVNLPAGAFFSQFWGSLPSTFKIFRLWKKSSTIKSWPTFCDQYFWKFPIWNSRADEKCREIRMVKVNVIFNDIRLLICLTPLQVNWVMVIN